MKYSVLEIISHFLVIYLILANNKMVMCALTKISVICSVDPFVEIC